MDELLRKLGRHQRLDLEGGVEPTSQLTGAERAAILDEVMERLGDETEGAVIPLAPRGPDRNDDDIRLEERRASRPSAVLWGALLAAAAAILLLWRTSAVDEPDEGPRIARLPDYRVTQLQGGIARSRSAPEPARAASTLQPASTIDWVFTPEGRVSTPVAVAIVATSASGSIEFEPRVDARVSAQGVVRLSGPLDAFIALEPGDWTLAVLIAPPADLPSDAAAAQAQDSPAWQAMELSLTIVARPRPGNGSR